ncbi:cell surface glycoprotein 1-like [Leptopilina boulardi]|uniref:cell surface glycoprotein 1-like n=1 Tax=Leptopilina boulardi TaxID=63433 RepID=UPI0021F559A9|nr:cell surface glycoprotein 1-like [Leptopilina boulardi]
MTSSNNRTQTFCQPPAQCVPRQPSFPRQTEQSIRPMVSVHPLISGRFPVPTYPRHRPVSTHPVIFSQSVSRQPTFPGHKVVSKLPTVSENTSILSSPTIPIQPTVPKPPTLPMQPTISKNLTVPTNPTVSENTKSNTLLNSIPSVQATSPKSTAGNRKRTTRWDIDSQEQLKKSIITISPPTENPIEPYTPTSIETYFYTPTPKLQLESQFKPSSGKADSTSDSSSTDSSSSDTDSSSSNTDSSNGPSKEIVTNNLTEPTPSPLKKKIEKNSISSMPSPKKSKNNSRKSRSGKIIKNNLTDPTPGTSEINTKHLMKMSTEDSSTSLEDIKKLKNQPFDPREEAVRLDNICARKPTRPRKTSSKKKSDNSDPSVSKKKDE